MAKCSKLFDLSTSPKSADIINEICQENFLRPVPTRWNSLYTALERLLKMRNGLSKVCEKLKVPMFTETELELLNEFVKISEPVAKALDKLQGEKGLYMGSALPALVRLESKLVALEGSCKHCKPFLDAYLNGLCKRFGSILTINEDYPSDLVYGAMSHPYHKLRWVNDTSKHDKLKHAFIEEVRRLYTPRVLEANSSESTYDDYFDYDDEPVADLSDSIELECYKYFHDKSVDLNILKKDYPNIEVMFRRYNTGLPSSAAVERLFSYGGLILTSRRCCLSDSKFEKLVMLKSNNVFENRK